MASAASDDAPLLKQDCAASIVVPADGTYVIQVRESAYAGNGACQYRLHVGTFPRPTAVVKATAADAVKPTAAAADAEADVAEPLRPRSP